jgi:hypothetical protein
MIPLEPPSRRTIWPWRMRLVMAGLVAAAILNATGTISPTVALVTQGWLIAFSLGGLVEVMASGERARKQAIASTEAFLREADRAIVDGEVSDDDREELERHMSQAHGVLMMMEKAAPLHVKLRRRIKR